jgi:hypothetical protein
MTRTSSLVRFVAVRLKTYTTSSREEWAEEKARTFSRTLSHSVEVATTKQTSELNYQSTNSKR